MALSTHDEQKLDRALNTALGCKLTRDQAEKFIRSCGGRLLPADVDSYLGKHRVRSKLGSLSP